MTITSKLSSAIILIAVTLSACSPQITASPGVPTGSPIPSSTATEPSTLTPTATETPVPSSTPTATITRTPRPSFTPTQDVRMLLDQAVTEAGLVFSDELSAAYQADNGRYGGSIHFSLALAEAGGFSSIEISAEQMRRIILDIFGHAAYASLYNHPRYDQFQVLVPDGDNEYQHMVSPQFIQLAEQYAANLDFKFIANSSVYPNFTRLVHSSSVTIKDIHMHFVKMDELPALKGAFERLEIKYFDAFPGEWTARRAANGAQQAGLLVLSGSSLYVYGYDNGNSQFSDGTGFHPMEQSKGSIDLKKLKAFEELVGYVEWWISLMFSSQIHPNFRSIFTTISMEVLCADSLENLDKYSAWLTACNPTAEGIFK